MTRRKRTGKMAEDETQFEKPRRFMRCFYRNTSVFGLPWLLIALAGGGWWAMISAGIGLGLVLLVMLMWQINLVYMVRPGDTSALGHTAFNLFRYGLLGGIIYAIIRLLPVQWLWFIWGTAMLLPALIVTTIMIQKNESASS